MKYHGNIHQEGILSRPPVRDINRLLKPPSLPQPSVNTSKRHNSTETVISGLSISALRHPSGSDKEARHTLVLSTADMEALRSPETPRHLGARLVKKAPALKPFRPLHAGKKADPAKWPAPGSTGLRSESLSVCPSSIYDNSLRSRYLRRPPFRLSFGLSGFKCCYSPSRSSFISWRLKNFDPSAPSPGASFFWTQHYPEQTHERPMKL